MRIDNRDMREPAVSLCHDCHAYRKIDVFGSLGGPGGDKQNGIAKPLVQYLYRSNGCPSRFPGTC
jgi:hypothetical protein